jgi:hypothetical protein
MEFFRDEDAFCVRAFMGPDFIVLKLTFDSEPIPDPYVRQVPYAPWSKEAPPEQVRRAVLAGAEHVNRSCGLSLWPLSIEFQLERDHTATLTLERFTRAILERLCHHGASSYPGHGDAC